MSDETEKPEPTQPSSKPPEPLSKEAKRKAAEGLANKCLALSMGDDQAKNIESVLKLTNLQEVPPEAIIIALEATMPKEWLENETLQKALFDAPENTLRAMLALSALWYNLAYAKGYYSGQKKAQAKK